MQKIPVGGFDQSAYYITKQGDADDTIRQILNSIKPDQEQIFGDVETAPKIGWEQDYCNRNIEKELQPGLDPYKSAIRLYQIGFRDHIYLYDLFALNDLTLLRTLMQHEDIWSWWYNGKFDYKQSIINADIVISNIVDFQTGAKLLNFPKSEWALADMYLYFCHEKLDKSQQKSYWSTPVLSEQQLTYAAIDIAAMMRMRAPFVAEIKKRRLWKAFSIECGAIQPTGEFELNGSLLDCEITPFEDSPLYVPAHTKTMRAKDTEVTELGHDLLLGLGQHMPQATFEGMTPNINLKSNKQLLDLLQRAGADIEGTSKRELKLKALNHPLTAGVLAFRKATKLLDSYGEKSLFRFVHPITKRIHATFHHLFGPKTYRYSSAKPNLQQVPRDKSCRAWFTAMHNWKIVIADYSAIEMLGAGVVAKDARLLEMFRRKVELGRKRRRGELVTEEEDRLADPHYVTSTIITGKPILDIVKNDRQNAKPANFGLIYGMSPDNFRVYAFVEYGVVFTQQESRDIHAAFFSHAGYEGLNQWHKDSQNFYKNTPSVYTLAGYDIPLDYNAEFDSFGGPAALNYQVQNPCAAGNKRGLALLWKMCRPWMNLAQRWTGPMLVRTVHDENHLEAPDSMVEEAKDMLERAMTEGMNKVINRDDLVFVEASAGQTWAAK